MGSLSEWLHEHAYGTAAALAKAVTEHVGRPISKQLLNSYLTGSSTPPPDVIKAIRRETGGYVKEKDWIELAHSVGRTNVAPSGRNVRPYRERTKPTRRRSKREV